MLHGRGFGAVDGNACAAHEQYSFRALRDLNRVFEFNFRKFVLLHDAKIRRHPFGIGICIPLVRYNCSSALGFVSSVETLVRTVCMNVYPLGFCPFGANFLA